MTDVNDTLPPLDAYALEAAAKAACRAAYSGVDYNSQPEGTKDDWREVARKAIEAYLRSSPVSDVNADLLTALKVLLNSTMFKDHPEESQMAIDAIARAEFHNKRSTYKQRTVKMRITRHTAMMQHAEVASRRSTCFRRNVGAVITVSNNIVSIGYNGAPAGQPHCLGASCVPPGQLGCTRAIHAEINALSRVPVELQWDIKTLYVTESPCYTCAQVAVVQNVTQVYYLHEYRDPAGIDHLIACGIPVFRLTPSGYIIDRTTGELIGDI